MGKLYKIFVLFVLLSISSVDNTYAQAEVSNGYNPLSLRQVHESYLMWKRTLWRRVDLKEKQNKPFFAMNRELSKIIISAVERGVDPFATDEEEIETGPIFIPNREFSIFEIKEDLYFDRIHSRIYFDIQSISMYLPGDSFYNLTGVEKPVASFRFIDLYNLFKSMPKEAIWFNDSNIAQHKNLGDAFLLRLFKGIIVKVANADDVRVSELYAKSRKDGIMASFKVEQDLMEWEANLWEY